MRNFEKKCRRSCAASKARRHYNDLVTHDQEEALSLSDRIGILGCGRLQQLGTPLDVYRTPANQFVAEFIGQVNLLKARASKIQPSSGGYGYETVDFEVYEGVPLTFEINQELSKTTSVLFMVRPERISVSFEKQKNRLIEMPATITEVSYAGHALRLKAAVFKGEWIIQAPDPQFPRLPKAGDQVYLSLEPGDLFRWMLRRMQMRAVEQNGLLVLLVPVLYFSVFSCLPLVLLLLLSFRDVDAMMNTLDTYSFLNMSRCSLQTFI
ncbi:TOBE domain-containing protein [Bacillus licheniformis]|nr:TOBE domain-containing protein [Bacillus licheniformis]